MRAIGKSSWRSVNAKALMRTLQLLTRGATRQSLPGGTRQNLPTCFWLSRALLGSRENGPELQQIFRKAGLQVWHGACSRQGMQVSFPDPTAADTPPGITSRTAVGSGPSFVDLLQQTGAVPVGTAVGTTPVSPELTPWSKQTPAAVDERASHGRKVKTDVPRAELHSQAGPPMVALLVPTPSPLPSTEVKLTGQYVAAPATASDLQREPQTRVAPDTRLRSALPKVSTGNPGPHIAQGAALEAANTAAIAPAQTIADLADLAPDALTQAVPETSGAPLSTSALVPGPVTGPSPSASSAATDELPNPSLPQLSAPQLAAPQLAAEMESLAESGAGAPLAELTASIPARKDAGSRPVPGFELPPLPEPPTTTDHAGPPQAALLPRPSAGQQPEISRVNTALSPSAPTPPHTESVKAKAATDAAQPHPTPLPKPVAAPEKDSADPVQVATAMVKPAAATLAPQTNSLPALSANAPMAAVSSDSAPATAAPPVDAGHTTFPSGGGQHGNPESKADRTTNTFSPGKTAPLAVSGALSAGGAATSGSSSNNASGGDPAKTLIVPAPSPVSSTHLAPPTELKATAPSAAASSSGADVTPNPHLPSVAQARLMQSLNGSQMQVDLTSAEFGRVTVHAGYARTGLSAQISLDSAQLGAAITAHLPGVEQKLSEAHGLRASLQISTATPGEDGRGGQRESGSRQNQSAYRGRFQGDDRAHTGLAEFSSLSSSTVSSLQETAGQLNIRI